MDDNKKIQERIVLDRFRNSFAGFPKGRIIRSESPDFLLRQTPKKTLGIEIMALPSARYDLTGNQKNRLFEDIAASVAKKEKKLAGYMKKRALAYWLIVYADLIDDKGIDLQEQLIDHKLNTNFDNVFVFELFDGKVWDLSFPRE